MNYVYTVTKTLTRNELIRHLLDINYSSINGVNKENILNECHIDSSKLDMSALKVELDVNRFRPNLRDLLQDFDFSVLNTDEKLELDDINSLVDKLKNYDVKIQKDELITNYLNLLNRLRQIGNIIEIIKNSDELIKRLSLGYITMDTIDEIIENYDVKNKNNYMFKEDLYNFFNTAIYQEMVSLPVLTEKSYDENNFLISKMKVYIPKQSIEEMIEFLNMLCSSYQLKDKSTRELLNPLYNKLNQATNKIDSENFIDEITNLIVVGNNYDGIRKYLAKLYNEFAYSKNNVRLKSFSGIIYEKCDDKTEQYLIDNNVEVEFDKNWETFIYFRGNELYSNSKNELQITKDDNLITINYGAPYYISIENKGKITVNEIRKLITNLKLIDNYTEFLKQVIKELRRLKKTIAKREKDQLLKINADKVIISNDTQNQIKNMTNFDDNLTDRNYTLKYKVTSNMPIILLDDNLKITKEEEKTFTR